MGNHHIDCEQCGDKGCDVCKPSPNTAEPKVLGAATGASAVRLFAKSFTDSSAEGQFLRRVAAGIDERDATITRLTTENEALGTKVAVLAKLARAVVRDKDNSPYSPPTSELNLPELAGPENHLAEALKDLPATAAALLARLRTAEELAARYESANLKLETAAKYAIERAEKAEAEREEG